MILFIESFYKIYQFDHLFEKQSLYTLDLLDLDFVCHKNMIDNTISCLMMSLMMFPMIINIVDNIYCDSIY